MRVLVACTACTRQFDAAGLKVGSKFHCRCGELLRVPEPKAQDAAVVRCTSCAGPRTADATSCRYCGADFTIHEQDRETLCGHCMARISNRAKFCHHCGTAVVVDGKAGGASSMACPACPDGQKMHHRVLGSAEAEAALLECGRCGGLWIGQDRFRDLIDRVRGEGLPEPDTESLLEERKRKIQSTVKVSPDGPLYRRCPECREWMSRKNHGRSSGVIVDNCPDHGVWFDADELEALLRWIRQGGELLAARRQDEQRKQDRTRSALQKPLPGEGESPYTWTHTRERDLLGGVIRGLFDLF